MDAKQRSKKLAYAKDMVKATQKRIRRLNTALQNWERRVKMHEKALADDERETYIRTIEELKSKIGGTKRVIHLPD